MYIPEKYKLVNFPTPFSENTYPVVSQRVDDHLYGWCSFRKNLESFGSLLLLCCFSNKVPAYGPRQPIT